ncbi:hypothetical protein ACHAXN_013421 [Cyclotella atomus]|jgi:intraflagellar transport protein 140
MNMSQMLHAYNKGTAAIRTDAHNVIIDHSGCDKLLNLSSSIPISGLDCGSRQVVIWNGSLVQVYRILESGVELVSDLQLDSVKSVSMSRDSLFILSGNSLVVMAEGYTRHVMEFSNDEGQPLLCDINMNNDLVVVTSNGFLKVFDVKDPDSIVSPCPPFNLHELAQDIDPIGEIFSENFSVKCNANASLISIASKHDGASRLFVYNTLRNELKLVHSDNSANTLFHCWDPAEPRLLGYDCISNDSFTTLCFVDEEGGGIYQQETIHHPPASRLMGVDAPYVLFAQEDGKVYNQTMTGFVGLEDESPLVLAALIDFSFYSIGDVDKSLEALQYVKSPNAWKNLAPICISMKRLDLVKSCLSNVASQEGLAEFELAQKEPEVECAFAFAAIQFGLYDTAKEFYIECNRHDLLNQLLQKLGQWDDAMKVAEGNDRLHLDLTRYNFARSLESKGELDMAMSILGKDAKKSAKFKQLVQERRLDELEYFVSQQNEKDLYSWLGDYFISLNDHVKACDYYALAGNDLKLVELYCNEGNFETARGVVEEGENAAAAYFLARFYTGREAVHLYTMGGLFNHAIRVAMSDGLDSELLEIAQKCNPEQASACARYFEKKGLLSDACKLYAKSGQESKALSLCLAILDKEENSDATDVLVSIVKESKEIPSDLSEKILQQLQQAGETDLMLDVVMCSNAKDPQTCLRFCSEHNVQLTQDVASNMLLLCESEKEKHELACMIAEKSFEQRDYLLASDLYSRCGQTKLALKCLVRTGNPGAIISYANQLDSKSVYALAASSLQKL